MKYLSLFLFSLFLFTSSTEPKKPFVVVQLFTSQGCSSCPPADALIEKIKDEYKDQNVFVMSYHVDYWDRLGWKDPFSQREFTELQYEYAEQFRERRVYTPQIVMNGKEHFVGSNSSKLRSKIKNYLKLQAENTLTFTKTADDEGNTVLNYEVDGKLRKKKVKLAFVLENSVTEIKRGENSNRTLSNSNIVLQESILELNDENKGSVIIPSLDTGKGNKILLIAFVQNEKLQITGATQVDI